MKLNLNGTYSPTERQWEAHNAPEEYILYGGAVGGGKSVWLCMEALKHSIQFPGNVGYLCRHELTSLRRTTLLTLERFLARIEQPEYLIEQHHRGYQYYEFRNGSRIFYGGLGDESHLDRLKSMDLGWVALDQCEETSEDAFLLLASRLRYRLPDGSQPVYKLLCTANPDPGWPRQRWIEQELPNHRFIPALPTDNPHLPDDYVDKLRELYPPEIAAALLDGDWDVITGADYLFNYRDVNEAIGRELDSEGDLVFGVDVAAFGDDETVLVARRGPTVETIRHWRHHDSVGLAELITPIIKAQKPVAVNVDDVGYGHGLWSILSHTDFGYQVAVAGINVGRRANDRERYYNLRAEAFDGLAQRFRDGDIAIPDDAKLRAELTSIRYRQNQRGQRQIESKPEMKKRGLSSPDRADALMLAFLPTPRFEIAENPFFY